jgi:hypothetical protein
MKLHKIVAVTLLFFGTQLQAFDGLREGFLLGFGLGVSNTQVEKSIEGYETRSDYTESGFATSVKLGYALNEQFALYYVRNASWYTIGAEDESTVSGIAGLGATYYFTPEPQSLYINVALGLGDIIDMEENDVLADGSSLMLGVGYEFTQHWQAEVNWFSGSLEGSNKYDGLNIDQSSLQFTINYLLY